MQKGKNIGAEESPNKHFMTNSAVFCLKKGSKVFRIDDQNNIVDETREVARM